MGSGAGELRGAGAAVPRAAWVEKVNNVHTDQVKCAKKVYREYAGCGQVLIPKERVQADESEYFVERTFDGSLPAFLTAFLGGKTITEHEAERFKKMIDEHIG